jgi:hypothetical protein
LTDQLIGNTLVKEIRHRVDEDLVVVLFFDNEADYDRADATLSAMPTDETPGRRSSVGKYEVAVRATA